MNYVQPIRDSDQVRELVNYFKDRNHRDYIMFLLGIYAGRRISDILRLRVKDVQDKDSMMIKEKKTGKQTPIEFAPELRRALKEYCENKSPDEFLIKSQKGTNQPITRQAAYRILNEAAKHFRLEHIGTHTLRKTFGYHLYYSTKKNIGLVMNALLHSSESSTLKYIGVTNEQINDAIKAIHY
jgi:integrase